jgi:Zn-dependent protease
MFQSLRLGKFFGIDLYVHGTFWLLPLFVLLTGVSAGGGLAAAGAEVGFLFAVFGCVFLHEVGHALAARAYGIGTRDITLYPVGGVASLDRLPEKPGQEIAIALAGPAVNLVIAGALFLGFVGAAYLTPWVPDADNALDVFGFRLMTANLVLAAFNLLPVFPMDGGRVLRAALATKLTRVRATEVAAGVGAVAAGALVVVGLMLPNFGLVLAAAMVWLLGQAELAGVRARAAAAEWESAAPTADGFTGLVWDETRRVWVQYKNGHVVRVIDPDA